MMDRSAKIPAPGRILVPLDGSPLANRAIPYAKVLGGPDARIILLRVIAEANPRSLGSEPSTDDRRDRARRELADWARQLDLEPDGLEIGVGDPAEEIVRVADEQGADLIVMASRERGPAERPIFGSVADRVVRAAGVPVMVVRPRDASPTLAPPQIGRLVVPLDGSARAAQALPTAKTLAKRLDLPVHLLTVINPARAIPPGMAYDAVLRREMLAGLECGARQVLDRAGAYLLRGGVPASWDLLFGATSASITQATAPGDVIVMASHGHGGEARRPLGSIAEELVRESQVPVLVFRAVPEREVVVQAFPEAARLRPVTSNGPAVTHP